MKVSKGFTLVEVMVATSILAFCLVGVLGAYASLFILADVSRNTSLVSNAVQFEMEQLKKESFDTLDGYNNQLFYVGYTSVAHTNVGITSTSPDDSLIIAVGKIEISDIAAYTKSSAKQIRIVASFKSKNRVIGEDTNLNGDLDTGEDANGNNRLDSPVELVTLIVR